MINAGRNFVGLHEDPEDRHEDPADNHASFPTYRLPHLGCLDFGPTHDVCVRTSNHTSHRYLLFTPLFHGLLSRNQRLSNKFDAPAFTCSL